MVCWSQPGWMGLDQNIFLNSCHCKTLHFLQWHHTFLLSLLFYYSSNQIHNKMEPMQFMEWMEDDDEVIAFLQLTVALLLKIKSKHGGSQFGRREINQNRLQGNKQLYNNYFSDSPVCPEYVFCRFFRMQRSLFLKIFATISEEDHYLFKNGMPHAN